MKVNTMKTFALVLARDKNHIEKKMHELDSLDIPFRVVCGEKLPDERVIYRPPRGKYDAINYGARFLPPDSEIIIMNDVDTEINDLASALNDFRDPDVGLVFARVGVEKGPQTSFYKLLDVIRSKILIASSGELIIIRKKLLDKILPMKACKAEDSYIMFKVLESKHRVVFNQDTYVKTDRTNVPEEEEKYKRRTVGGLYQALSMSKPPISIRVFYTLLPLASPILLVMGEKGYYWMRGILLGYVDYLRGDTSGQWKQTY
jgi:cellulose synthase/poly-beta-1,6-N-acetylglucosamine synthase-like glycosyltransferase